MNAPNTNDATIQYLPEPWWGNDGTHPLHSVVINFNPGKGGKVQKFNYYDGSNYNTFVKNRVGSYISSIQQKIRQKITDNKDFWSTCNWHYSKRAKWIFEAITHICACPQNQFVNNQSLHNHLSVELIPWHSESTNSDFHRYVAKNRDIIFNRSVKFAADASKCINNPILRNVVIVKMSSNAFKSCLGGIGGLNYLKQEKEAGSGIYSIFEFTTIPNVMFVCVWGERSRNAFPSKDTLVEVLKEIILYKSIKY